MLESSQQTKRSDLNYYIVNCQCFMVGYIVSCNFQNTNLQVFPTNPIPGKLINHCKHKKEAETKIEKDLKHFCKQLLGIFDEFP